MAYTSVASPPKHNGAIFNKLSDIPSPDESDVYLNTDDGGMVIRDLGGWKSLNSAISSVGGIGTHGFSGRPGRMGVDGVQAQVLIKSKFIEYCTELVLFNRIAEKRYFQLKKLYGSESVENRITASNIVLELHKKLVEDNA